LIDLQLNYPIVQGQEELFTRLLREIVAADATQSVELGPRGGSDEHRQAAAGWLSRNGHVVAKARVLFCNGGHHAVMVSLLAVGLTGRRVAVDPVTYGNFKTQAASLGIELLPCEGDEQGMKPGALRNMASIRSVCVLAAASRSFRARSAWSWRWWAMARMA